jgi:photosystem II stability/assembly factor-like uncharacterized protein
MPETRHLSPRAGDVLLMVGTTKGAFLFRSDRSRKTWQRGGPYFAGLAVYAMAYDDRTGRPRLWAGPESSWFGPAVSRSDDFGRTWSGPTTSIVKFPEDTATTLKRVWQIMPGRSSEPDSIYCGVEPAALFESKDGGESFALVRGLWNHPHRAQWQPGGGGLCMHTIVPHPVDANRMWVAISTGGVYRTEDGGRSWRTAHKGVRAEFMPNKHPEFGQCVHKVVRHPARPERLYLQNHWGLYRSDDGGDSWKDIAKGVPSDFGFGMAAHPHDADTVYIAPLESDQFRCMPQGRLRIYRTRNGGASWQAMTKGLPQKDAYETVLRDALTTDPLPKAGVYFGTRNGTLYGSADDGTSWHRIAEGLPPVVCVKAAVIAGMRRVSAPKRRPAARRPAKRPTKRR